MVSSLFASKPRKAVSKRPFKKILIANRGEIAVRIIQSCRSMGIKTVAIYSEADTNALHVREADEAVYVGASPSSASYLNVEAIMSAIDQTGAEAVHPGYGFLSENASFATRLEERGVTLIGPPPEAIRLMGDKIESKKIAKKAGVTVVPGGLDAVEAKDAAKLAQKIGYPVMIKAAAGGGGKGMRVARCDEELQDGLRLASSEAASSFGDARVFIEKFFENPRHIEIQVLADKHGNVIHLGERECSIQRRHQKVIEEAPSTFIDETLRAKMGKQAVALAKRVDYYSAGTVEFIVDDKGNFYFLEMNTRLQVEHRVTELITGLDLVEQMIRIAAGEALPLEQKDVTFNGWAMEARIYAEDPKRGFLPSVGRITRYQEPEKTKDILVDSGIYEGGEVSMFYDPMVAKLCTHKPTRSATIEAMQQALSSFVIDGIAHNVSFLHAIFANPRFAEGDISTNFIAQEYPDGFVSGSVTEDIARVLIGVASFITLRDAERASQTTGQLHGRTRQISGRWVATIGERDYPVNIIPRDGGYDITYEDGLIVIRSNWQFGRELFQGHVNNKPISVLVRIKPDGYHLTYNDAESLVRLVSPRVAELLKYMPKTSSRLRDDSLVAPIAGLVTSIKVRVGDEICAGQELLVIEAMKMENILRAEKDGIVKAVHVTPPSSVRSGQTLIEFGTRP